MTAGHKEQTREGAGGKWVWYALAGITLVGAYFRLAHLGDAALRADTINFWRICEQSPSAGYIFKNWMQLGQTGHFPFPNAVIKWFVSFFNLELTHTTARVPSAIWGILSIPVAYGLGRRFGGAGFGLLVAGMLAVHPYHIQLTREVYFYPPMMLGAFLTTWTTVWAVQAIRGREPLPPAFFVALAAGVFLLVYSLPGGWILFILCLAAWLGVLGWRQWKGRPAAAQHWMGPALYLVLMFPFFFASWGFKQFGSHVGGGAVREAGKKALATYSGSLWTMLEKMVTSYGWGATPLRFGLTLVVLAVAVHVIVRERRERPALWIIPSFFVGGIAIFLVAREAGGMLYEPRYLMFLLPLYLVVLALGLTGLAKVPALRPYFNRVPGLSWALPAGLVVLLSAQGAFAATRLSGSPTPYKEIRAWANERLPAGTPVLVDRWLEPWNELKVYNATNVYFTFTVPNEPLENFRNANWRETVKQFFARFPDAVYLEISKPFERTPEVGPWDWPETYFARRHVIRNEAGLTLRRLGQAFRSDFYVADTNRVVVTYYYNRTDDLLNKAEAAGMKALVLYGAGWLYHKTPDYRDWRMLQHRALLHLYNFTDEPQRVRLVIAAGAAGGTKRVTIGGTDQVFEPGGVRQLALGPIELPPGLSPVELVDPQWGNTTVPLLVAQVRLMDAREEESRE